LLGTSLNATAAEVAVKRQHVIYSTEGLEVVFPDMNKCPAERIGELADEYVHVFDECLEVVSHIIATDIWPRFRKSPLFDAAKKEHQSLLGEKC
jgi:hypothetical protein